MALAHSPSIVMNGLVLCLDAGNTKSYPGSGTTWTDLSGKGNTGTLTNGPTYSSSNGGSIVFDAIDDFVTSPSSSDFAFGTGDFTLDVWVYPVSFSSYTHMISLPDQNTFGLKAGRTGDNPGVIYFFSTSYTTFGSIAGWTLTLNTWQNVLFKRESSVGYGFLNGKLIGSASLFTNNFSAQTLNIHKGHPTEFTQCRMSSIKIYKRALTASEISQNFNALRGRFGI